MPEYELPPVNMSLYTVIVTQVDIERLDPCGRTALHVAVSLGRTECVKLLLDHHANANATNKQGWNGITTFLVKNIGCLVNVCCPHVK